MPTSAPPFSFPPRKVSGIFYTRTVYDNRPSNKNREQVRTSGSTCHLQHPIHKRHRLRGDYRRILPVGEIPSFPTTDQAACTSSRPGAEIIRAAGERNHQRPLYVLRRCQRNIRRRSKPSRANPVLEH